jgi:hypothetical protein
MVNIFYHIKFYKLCLGKESLRLESTRSTLIYRLVE